MIVCPGNARPDGDWSAIRSGGNGASLRSPATWMPKPAWASVAVAVPTSIPTTDGTGTLLPLTTAAASGGKFALDPSRIGDSACVQMDAENAPNTSPPVL